MKSIVNTPFYYFTEALPANLCDKIIEQGLKLDFKKAGVNADNKPDTRLRIGSVSWFDLDSETALILQRYVMVANEKANWNCILENAEKPQFSIYHKAGKYGWHRDTNVHETVDSVRKLSITVQLSSPSDYTGGELQIKNFYGKEIKGCEEDMKKRGTIVVFPSLLEHQVTPVESGLRYSLVQWYRGPDWR